jgi:RNA recognition motif-containing protein
LETFRSIQLRTICETCSPLLITDRATGRSRGFAFVTMATEEAAKAAIAGAADKDLHGRKISVNEARPREERPGGPRPNQPR